MKRNATETIKTIAVCVLLVSLVCLCTVYLFSFERNTAPQFTASMLSSLISRSSKNVYLDEFSPSLVTPYFIGVSIDGEKQGVFTDTDNSSISTLYEQVAEFFPTLFAKGSVRALAEDEGRREFASALSGRFIYISYFAELPKSVIYYMTFPQNMSDDVSDEYISELVIFPSGSPTRIVDTDIYGQPITIELFAFSAIGRNDAGEYFLYYSDFVPQNLSDVYFGKSKISSYNMTGAVQFEFAADIADYTDSYVRQTTVITNDLTCAGANISLPLANISDNISSAVNAFGLHYEKAARYMDYDSSITFLEEGHNVRVTRGGVLYYNVTGSSGGVMMDSLGVPGESAYSISDYAFASLKLIKAMENDHGGLKLKLNGIYADGENIVVTLGYSCFNLAVVCDQTTDLFRFEFNSGKLMKAKVTLLSSLNGKKYEYIPQAWDLNDFAAMSERECDFLPVFVLKSNGDDKAVYAEWRALTANVGVRE